MGRRSRQKTQYEPFRFGINGFHHNIPRPVNQIEKKQYARVFWSIGIVFLALLAATAQRRCMQPMLLRRLCCSRLIVIATAAVWIIRRWHRISHCALQCVRARVCGFDFRVFFPSFFHMCRSTKPEYFPSPNFSFCCFYLCSLIT